MSDSIDILARRCTAARCRRFRFEGGFRCLDHLILDTLLEYDVIVPLRRSRTGSAGARQLRLRDHYVSFFSARAMGLARGEIQPCCRSPIDAISVALTVHPHTRMVHGRLFSVSDWTRLMLFVEAFDKLVVLAIRRKRDRRRMEVDQVLQIG